MQTRAIHTGTEEAREEQNLFWRIFYVSSSEEAFIWEGRITEAHVQIKWKTHKIAMNNTWNNKVHQKNMVLKREGNNLSKKVESHHQLVKRQTYRTVHNRSLLQKVIPKAKHNQYKTPPLAVMSKEAPNSIYFV